MSLPQFLAFWGALTKPCFSAEKHGLVRAPQKAKNCGSDIERAAELMDSSRTLHHRRPKNNQRNLIRFNGDALLAIHPGAVIRDHDKNGVGPERLLFGCLEKLAQGEVRIFHRILAFAFFGVFGDATFWKSERLVVGDGENRREKGFLCVCHTAKFLNGLREEILITDAPNCRERRLSKMFLLNKAVVTISQGVGTHAIEDSSSAIQESGGVAIALEDARNRLDIV